MEAVHKNWNYHNIDKKFETLLSLEYDGDKTAYIETINKLDTQITEMLVGAEKRCTKVSSHHLDDWSPEMMEALENRRRCKSKMTRASKINLKTDLVAAIENFRQKSKSYREAEEKYNGLQKRFQNYQKRFPKTTSTGYSH